MNLCQSPEAASKGRLVAASRGAQPQRSADVTPFDPSAYTQRQSSPAKRRRIVLIGAAGRDFHNFNVVYRNDPKTEVVAFTAAQITGISGRYYPPSLAARNLQSRGQTLLDELRPVIRGMALLPEPEMAAASFFSWAHGFSRSQ